MMTLALNSHFKNHQLIWKKRDFYDRQDFTLLSHRKDQTNADSFLRSVEDSNLFFIFQGGVVLCGMTDNIRIFNKPESIEKIDALHE